MVLSAPSLYVVFARTGDVSKSLTQARRRAWTAPKDAAPGDIALFYFSGSERAIHAIGRTATHAFEGVPDKWTDSPSGYFARHKDIVTLDSPVSLDAIRQAFPQWKRWKNLFGVRVHIVPPEYRTQLSGLVAAQNATSRALLAHWLPAGSATFEPAEPSVFEGSLTEIVTFKQGRSRALRDRALKRSNGRCEACTVDYSTLLDGKGVRVLQVHHRKQLAATDRPRLTKLSDLAVVCANCHMLIHVNPKKALSIERLKALLSEAKA